MKPKNVRKITIGITPGLDLYLTEHAYLFRDRLDVQRLFRVAVEEGVSALIEGMKENNTTELPMRLRAVDGPRRMLDYEQQMEEIDKSLLALG